jgi:ribose transport system substrate-binding protein
MLLTHDELGDHNSAGLPTASCQALHANSWVSCHEKYFPAIIVPPERSLIDFSILVAARQVGITTRRKAPKREVCMKMKTFTRTVAGCLGLTACLFAAISTPSSADEKKHKVFVGIGFDGNTWMSSSANLAVAMAHTKAYKDRISDITVQSARGDPQTQIQQINAAVQSGVDIIILWPFSETATNRAIANACKQGVIVITYDSQANEPCVTTHIGIDQTWAGAGPAEGLVKLLNGKGNLIFMGGIPGNIVDKLRSDGGKSVFAKHPDIHIVAEAPSMWNPATARQKLTEIIAAQGWDKIDGLWTQTGCFAFSQLQVEANRPKLLPCAGNGTNGFRVSMLPKGSTAGALGNPGVSMGSPVWLAAYGVKLAFQVIDGGKVEKWTKAPMPLVTAENSKQCQTADHDELVKNDFACTAVPFSVAPDNFYIDVWNKWIPELDINSALHGTVPAGS